MPDVVINERQRAHLPTHLSSVRKRTKAALHLHFQAGEGGQATKCFTSATTGVNMLQACGPNVETCIEPADENTSPPEIYSVPTISALGLQL